MSKESSARHDVQEVIREIQDEQPGSWIYLVPFEAPGDDKSTVLITNNPEIVNNAKAGGVKCTPFYQTCQLGSTFSKPTEVYTNIPGSKSQLGSSSFKTCELGSFKRKPTKMYTNIPEVLSSFPAADAATLLEAVRKLPPKEEAVVKIDIPEDAPTKFIDTKNANTAERAFLTPHLLLVFALFCLAAAAGSFLFWYGLSDSPAGSFESWLGLSNKHPTIMVATSSVADDEERYFFKHTNPGA